MNALWVWVLYLCWGSTASVLGHSHSTTNLGSQRAQMNMGLCIDLGLLWYTYKAYIMIVRTSQTSIYMYNYRFGYWACYLQVWWRLLYVPTWGDRSLLIPKLHISIDTHILVTIEKIYTLQLSARNICLQNWLLMKKIISILATLLYTYGKGT